jgi:hypothetical protein
MEKVIYALWRDPHIDATKFNDELLGRTAQQLLDAGVRGLRLNLVDDAVHAASGLRRINAHPAIDAIAQLWMDVAHDEFRAPIDAVLRQAALRVSAWLVTESEPIRNTLHPPAAGERTRGWAQICFLQRPARLTNETWRELWHGSHTRVAIDTQSNFEYVQNTFVRALTSEAPPFSAMVEECFPAEAMTDPRCFFDAVGDEAKFRRNTEAMAASCARFIDMHSIDVIPTSQYVIRSPA